MSGQLENEPPRRALPALALGGHKSPIQIKYNYYDQNGLRHEQTNENPHNLNMNKASSQAGEPLVQRQLSPTFKQSLDQIVRNSSQQQQSSGVPASVTELGRRGTPPAQGVATPAAAQSPDANANPNPNATATQAGHSTHTLMRRYRMSSYEQRCLRCLKTVYQMDKVGPLKDFTFYHRDCFKCRECGTKLTLKTYFNNQQSSVDQEVYCHRHCPKTGPGKLDNQSVGIRAALNAPKVFENNFQNNNQVNFAQANGPLISPLSHTSNHSNAIENSHIQHLNMSTKHNANASIDSRALHIQHAVLQTKLHNIYKESQMNQQLSRFLNMRLEYLEPKQKLLEMRHREEEDALFKAFEAKWRQEESCITEQIRQEWQIELANLLDKYKRQLSSIKHEESPSKKPLKFEPHQKLIGCSNENGNPDHETDHDSNEHSSSRPQLNKKKQQMIEFERMNLETTMTLKLDKKRETLKRKLKEFERQATAELVEKQSKEMLALISVKLGEFKEEQKRKIGSDFTGQLEAIESLANQFENSRIRVSPHSPTNNQHQVGAPTGTGSGAPSPRSHSNEDGKQNQEATARARSATSANGKPATQSAAPLVSISSNKQSGSRCLSKLELYNSDRPEEAFGHIDELAINVAREDQQTFTDLVHHLTRFCLNDVEKVRAIFRWITVKNLNTMDFDDSSIKADTPLGLLRGIKNGNESYHVLFKRLCSYAGLHCVVIKGYSKSAGYQPGLRFEGSRFRNSWNAVFVAGAWRFVQCNWGARHLVSVAVMQDKNSEPAKESQHFQASSSKEPSITATRANKNKPNASHHLCNLEAAQLAALRQQHRHPGDHPIAGIVNEDSTMEPLHKLRQLQLPNVGGAGATPSQQSSGGRRGNPLLSSAAIPRSNTRSHNNSTGSSLSGASSSSASEEGSFNNTNNLAVPADSPHRPTKHALLGSPTTSTSSGGSASSTKSKSTTHHQSLNNNDSLRYEYDDHYFLTDPDEFIYEFFPLASEWQLISSPRPISIEEFEQLPFVRSLFFKYGLYFPQANIRSVLYTDSSGATTIKIGMPTHLIPSLIFHYNLKYYDSDREHFEGVSLKRFVMQSVENGSNDDSLANVVSFRVHLPESGPFILDIFANSITPTQYITGEPMKFKSVCKFKIVAKNLKTVMIPLPDCASGEFGPMKATRLFGIIPLTHESGLISVPADQRRQLEIQFRMSRPLLDFMATLHKNGYDERQLSRSVKIFIEGDIVTVAIKFFEEGQYGLDIYTRDRLNAMPTHDCDAKLVDNNSKRELKKQLLTHCCKYLINVKV